MSDFKHIAVLYGGWSAERDVSLSSGEAVAKALAETGYQVSLVDATENLAADLLKLKPDAVFNALHGRWGEDGCVQGLLEMLRIPYTHSGVLASAAAMHKPTAKEIFEGHGLQCPTGGTYTKEKIIAGEPMPRPFVVKPINEGSSVGVEICFPGDNKHYTAENWPFGDEVLIEPYIPGREIQVAVLDGEALGAIEICPNASFYDYEAKYTDGKAEHLMPAPIEPEAYAEVCDLAQQAHKALGCRGLTRSDFRYNDTDNKTYEAGQSRFYLLEINTQPGMTPLSLSPEIAAHGGISFTDLVEHLVQSATLDNVEAVENNNKKQDADHGEKETIHAGGAV
ncbi:MAG: D-alanine--D-alanine ligase [Rickettsiales bacterium]|nr:D-alanine--D-alanine ligase [Rickettsiales bacterium]